jgi:hypothetical protein
MNHVPDTAVAAIDALGEGLLVGEPRPVNVALREDLRLVIPVDDAALDAGHAPVEFHLAHTEDRERLRAHGSFVATVADGVETRLRGWGIDPPGRYARTRDRAGEPGDGDTWRVYAGTARL